MGQIEGGRDKAMFVDINVLFSVRVYVQGSLFQFHFVRFYCVYYAGGWGLGDLDPEFLFFTRHELLIVFHLASVKGTLFSISCLLVAHQLFK